MDREGVPTEQLMTTDIVTVGPETDIQEAVNVLLAETIETCMTEQVVTIKPDESIQTAAAKMITNGISHLPVQDGGEIVGMLSTTDITAYSVSRA